MTKNAATATGDATMDAVRLVEAERHRHFRRGYDAAHDDQFWRGELVDMAGWWLHPDSSIVDWPWDDDWPEHGERVDDLIKAAALIVAEVDRRIRDGEQPTAGTGRDEAPSTSDTTQVVTAARVLREAARSMTWDRVAWSELTALVVAVDALDGNGAVDE